MTMTFDQLQNILEAALMVAGRPLTVAQLLKLFDEGQGPDTTELKNALSVLRERYAENHGIELNEVASGYQFQAKTELSPWLSRLWEERPQRYSRALLETLALIAYRQPVTRAEVEEIRGVAVSSHITKTLLERDWIRVIGHREVPGKPALYGTTKEFLDHFNLKSLSELPTLTELKDLETQEARLQIQLELSDETSSSEESSTPDEHTTHLELTHTEESIDTEANSESTKTAILEEELANSNE
ncbi:MAG: SMC-Scp complex subunit ScpB [Gammaproteobacteria bacterium]